MLSSGAMLEKYLLSASEISDELLIKEMLQYYVYGAFVAGITWSLWSFANYFLYYVWKYIKFEDND